MVVMMMMKMMMKMVVCVSTDVLRLFGEEPQLGEHHIRRVPVHRLLRDAPLSGGSPVLHQVHTHLLHSDRYL